MIFLPGHALTWDDDQRDVVLAHEIAHLARWDPLRRNRATGRVVCWFLPLSWIAARQATVAREQACDETVLALGHPAHRCTRVLLALAESATTPPAAFGALPMVDRSFLETRVMTILSRRSPGLPAPSGSRSSYPVGGGSAARSSDSVRSASPTESAPAVPAHRKPTVRRQPRHVHQRSRTPR